jgi:hypothetical protein
VNRPVDTPTAGACGAPAAGTAVMPSAHPRRRVPCTRPPSPP